MYEFIFDENPATGQPHHHIRNTESGACIDGVRFILKNTAGSTASFVFDPTTSGSLDIGVTTPDGSSASTTLPGGASGAPADSTFVTTGDESGTLTNSQEHASLSGGALHAPASHDNAAHSAAFVTDGDGTDRQLWVIENGASNPSGASSGDIIFEKEA